MLTESFYLFLVRIFSAVIGIVVVSFITNNLAVESSGDYFLILSMVTFIIPFSLLGFGHLSLKDISKEEVGTVSKYFTIVVLMSILCGFLYVIYLFYFSNLANVVTFFELFFLFFIVVFSTISELYLFFFQGLKKAWHGTLYNVIVRQVLLLTLLWFFEVDSLFSLLAIYSFSSVWGVFISVIMLNKYNVKIRFVFQQVNIPSLYRKSRNFQITHILGTFNGSVAPILLGALADSKEVALFIVCMKISTISSFVMVPINRVVAPRYSHAFANDKLSELQSIATLACRVSLFFVLPLLILIFFLKSELLGYFGGYFRDNGEFVLVVILLAQLVNIITGSVGWLLQMCSQEKLFRDISIFSVFVSTLLGFYFIPIYGALGAAIMYSCSVFFTNILACYFVFKKLDVLIFKFW
ncbi:oligosaccharide flippase family protein [Paraglaciecola chathamensis]|uniref:Polysaccharide biosynthesis protein C-terminal domain-containing protein n=1 Tax=Paraglaciecola chathamensis S18K6 TaxID=1127672 RepID=A0AAV3V000_9ALTE|nr:oligosaccharide flippase family protein [Paraglaciecola chathamensis]GAC10543.1 hypothetical protein GCHA_2596 [Paraglaciecola chathamensis S18K6]